MCLLLAENNISSQKGLGSSFDYDINTLHITMLLKCDGNLPLKISFFSVCMGYSFKNLNQSKRVFSHQGRVQKYVKGFQVI